MRCCAPRATHEVLGRRAVGNLAARSRLRRTHAGAVRRGDLAFPAFAAPRNVAGLLDDTALLIMLALAQMLVILVRGIDLSIAANLALCGMLAALFNRAWPEAGVLPAMLLTLVAGGLLGAFNGILVWKLRLP